MTSPLVVLDPKKEVHFPGKIVDYFYFMISPFSHPILPGPYNKRFTAKLMIENVSQHKVAFRLMTLEPRHYIVDPSKGIIPAHQSTTVNIVLKTIENEANFKTATQKFLVQVVPAKPDSTSDSVSELVRYLFWNMMALLTKLLSPVFQSSHRRHQLLQADRRL